jgi:hypothetical protein
VRNPSQPFSIRFTGLLLSLLLTACASRPELPVEQPPPPITENPAIVTARADLSAARAAEAEWMVLEPGVDKLPVTLGALLDEAEAADESGDSLRATELAEKVSRLARLALEQAAAQADAGPFYPQ